MTNSTNNTTDNITPPDLPPIPGKGDDLSKKLGPIRWGAVIPFLIITGIPFLYYSIFFDSHFAFLIEKVGSKLNKAPVIVEKVESSFRHGSIKISKIAISDKDNSSIDSLRIGSIRFKMLWDGLLRAKIVIDEASVNRIELNVPKDKVTYIKKEKELIAMNQKHFGRLPAKEKVTVKGEAAEVLKKEYEGNILGDIAGILEGGDPLENLKPNEKNLSSLKKINELQNSLNQKEVKWNERMANLPRSEDFDGMSKQISSINTKKLKNLKDVKNTVKTLKNVIKVSKEKISVIKESKDAFTSDIKYFKNGINEVERLSREDYKNMESRLKIPKVDVGNLATQLFKSFIMKKLGKYGLYVEMVQEYLPESKKTDKKVKMRGVGINYSFGNPKTYPSFLVKKTTISSKANESAFSGNISGSIIDLTTDPKILQRPTKIFFKGDFPKQKIRGINSTIILDHTKDDAIETINVRVASYPMDAQYFIKSNAIKFGYKGAMGSTSVRGALKNGNLNLFMNNNLTRVNYDIYAKSSFMNNVLQSAVSKTSFITINGKIRGKVTSPQISVSSNLASALKTGLGEQVDKKIAESKRKLRKMLDDKISVPKKALESKFAMLSSKHLGKFNSLNNKSKGIEGLGNKKMKDAENSAKKRTKRKVKKKLKNKFKKLKF